MFRFALVFVLLFINAISSAKELNSASPEGAHVYLIAPSAGEMVRSPFKVKFGLVGMGVAPAGINADFTGHHHLLIDLQELPNLDLPLPASDQIRHFGKGQTETEFSLPPGRHTLQLMLGNYVHAPHNPAVFSEPIEIVVSE